MHFYGGGYAGTVNNTVVIIDDESQNQIHIGKNVFGDIMFDYIHDQTGELVGFIDVVLWRSCQKGLIKINGKKVAQLMFVIGTNGGGLWHPNWKQNLKFAIEKYQ